MLILNQHNFSLIRFTRSASSVPSANDHLYAGMRLCLVLEGSALWEIEGRAFPVRPGDLVFLNIGQRRRFLSFGADGFSLCIFSFPRNAFSRPEHYLFFCHMAKKNPFSHPVAASVLQQIPEMWETGDPLRYEWASAKLTEFFIRAEKLTGFTPGHISSKDLALLSRMDRIDADIACGLGLAEIAKAAGLSESAFSRRFAAAAGISFKQYAMEKKMQQALRLLQNTDMKMIDIAAQCGFQSISGFYHTFRKLFGTTPNTLR